MRVVATLWRIDRLASPYFHQLEYGCMFRGAGAGQDHAVGPRLSFPCLHRAHFRRRASMEVARLGLFLGQNGGAC